MVVDCAKHLVVGIGSLQPVIRYVKLVTRRRTNARERRRWRKRIGSAQNVGRKLLVIAR
jgi:hypothetical protein